MRTERIMKPRQLEVIPKIGKRNEVRMKVSRMLTMQWRYPKLVKRMGLETVFVGEGLRGG